MSEIYNFLLPITAVASGAFSVIDYVLCKNASKAKIKTSDTVKKMLNISGLIKQGGFKCLNTQYVPALIVFLALYTLARVVLRQSMLSIGMLVGFCSGISCVYYCFTVAMSGNIATAISASESLEKGFDTSYRFGRSVGLFILSASLFVVSAFYFIPKANRFNFMIGTAIGVSIVSIFARLAGGIFTKGADIGADIVGKVMKDMPEDDPRNPGTIADNIGDNIGDCVGTAADIHETYILAFLGIASFSAFEYISIPVVASVVGSMISLYTSGLKKQKKSEKDVGSAIIRMLVIGLVIAVAAFFIFSSIYNILNGAALTRFDLDKLVPFISGILYIPSIFLIVNYYTSKEFYPVKTLAKSCEEGPAMNIIAGYALSLQSAFVVLFVSCLFGISIYLVYDINGLMVTISTVLGFLPSVMAMDTYGPITDNAGGIVTMSGGSEKARENTDILDSIGNLTKALTKGYSSGITILTSFLILKLFFNKVYLINPAATNLSDPVLLFGLFLGASTPFIFSGLVIESVYKAAEYMVKAIQKIATAMTPDNDLYYTYPIKSLSSRSVRSMFLPVVSVLSPMLISYGIFWLTFSKSLYYWQILSGLIIGTTSTGLLLSICMTIGGATWDNGKKLVEEIFGKKIKELRVQFESLTQNGSKGSEVSVDSLQLITNSFDDLLNLSVTESDKGSVFDTFKQAVSNQNSSLKDWIIKNKSSIKSSSSSNIDFQRCFGLIKSGPEDGCNSEESVFVSYGELERALEVKKNAVVGDMLGDPLKDAAGTGLNSMVKLTLTLSLFILLTLAK